MKRFLIYVVVIICALFCGMMFYTFAQNNEQLVLRGYDDGDTIYMNPSDELELPVDHINKHKRTELLVELSDANIVTYNAEEKLLSAHSSETGGSLTLTISTTNDELPTYKLTIWVGNGSIQNPFFIKNATDLAMVGTDDESGWTLAKSYRLVNDVDLATKDTETIDYQWTPIGEDAPFIGNFDGDLYTINNIRCNKADTSEYAGLFGYVNKDAKISNVIVNNIEINGDYKYIGGIAARSEGTIEKCKVSNMLVNAKANTEGSETISSDVEQYVGGIAGLTNGAGFRTRIEMCEVSISELNSTNYVGGIVGKATGSIVFNCKTQATFGQNASMTAEFVGGIIGYCDTVSVSQTFLGDTINFTRPTIVKNCFSYNSFNLDTAYVYTNVGPIVGDRSYVGVEEEDNIIVANVYSNPTSPVGFNDYGIATTDNLTSSQILLKASYPSTWDFTNCWQITDETTMASVRLDGEKQDLGVIESGTMIASNDDAKAFIKKLIENNAISNGYSFIIDGDLTVDASTLGVDWAPIGTKEVPFVGQIVPSAGSKLTVKNITINSDTLEYVGMFGYTKNAVVGGIRVESITITAGENAYVGAFVGYNGGKVSGIEVAGININGGQYVGGIVGENAPGCEISDSNILDEGELEIMLEGETIPISSYMKVDGANEKYVGGFAGRNLGLLSGINGSFQINAISTLTVNLGGMVGANIEKATIVNCGRKNENIIATAPNAYVGGMVGNNNGIIERCYASGSDAKTGLGNANYAGGFAGATGSSSYISYSYSEVGLNGFNSAGVSPILNGTVTNCYSTSKISSAVLAGGFSIYLRGTIMNSYYRTDAVTLVKNTTSSAVPSYAGFSLHLSSGSSVKYCFTSCVNGVSAGLEDYEAYPETQDLVRSFFASFEQNISNNSSSWDRFTSIFSGNTYTNEAYGKVISSASNEKGVSYTSGKFYQKYGFKIWNNKNSEFRYYSVLIDGASNLGSSQVEFFAGLFGNNKAYWSFNGTWPELVGLNLDPERIAAEAEE